MTRACLVLSFLGLCSPALAAQVSKGKVTKEIFDQATVPKKSEIRQVHKLLLEQLSDSYSSCPNRPLKPQIERFDGKPVPTPKGQSKAVWLVRIRRRDDGQLIYHHYIRSPSGRIITDAYGSVDVTPGDLKISTDTVEHRLASTPGSPTLKN